MQLPTMVKQIGRVSGNERVYIEDYVYAYLNKLTSFELIMLPIQTIHYLTKTKCYFPSVVSQEDGINDQNNISYSHL